MYKIVQVFSNGSAVDALLGLKVLENMDRLTDTNTIKTDDK